MKTIAEGGRAWSRSVRPLADTKLTVRHYKTTVGINKVIQACISVPVKSKLTNKSV